MKRIYEDDYWTIDLLLSNDNNSIIRITCFKDNHYVDELELSKQIFEDDNTIEEIKDIVYR